MNWKKFKKVKKKKTYKGQPVKYTYTHMLANGEPTKVGTVYGHVASGQSLWQASREATGVSNKTWVNTIFGP